MPRSSRAIRTTSNADQANAAPVTRKVKATLVPASTSPPAAGPRKMATLSIVLPATFAAVSSSGVRASAGTSAAWAGRNPVVATITATVSAYTTTLGADLQAASAAAPSASARTTSDPIMTSLRE